MRLLIATQGTDSQNAGARSIRSQRNVNTRCRIVSFGPILELIAARAQGGSQNMRKRIAIGTQKQEF
jgi:hypothetical protein